MYYSATESLGQVASHLADAAQALDAASRALRRSVAEGPPPPEDAPLLRGKDLQVKIAEHAASIAPDAWPLHYRDWFTMLEHAGYRVGGRDPLATFLTALTRLPQIESAGARSGLYRLADPEPEVDR